MAVRTSQVTSDDTNDLSITPASGKNLKIASSLDKGNAGETPLATTSSTGVVKRLDMDNLELHPPTPQDDDWVLYQDTSDSKKVKKLKATDLGGAKQPPFGDLPTQGPWLDTDTTLAVKEGGAGSTADLRNSVEFAVNDNTYNQSDKNVVANNTVKVRWMESKMISASHGQTISGTLYGKTGSKFTQTWNLNITKQPTGGWVLADLINQPKSTAIDSYVTIPTGFNAPSPVTIDGGTLTSIQVSVNGAPFTGSPGNIKDGETIQVRGTTGAADNTTYTALVSIGGVQQTWNVTTAVPSLSVAQPTITAPVDGSTGLGSSITVTSSAYTPVNGAGTHASSDWQLKKAGVVVSSSMADTVNLESWTIPPGDLEANTDYTVRVLHRSDDPIDSPWSVESTFSTGTFVLEIGDPVGGGFFVGQYKLGRGLQDATYVIPAPANNPVQSLGSTPTSDTIYNLIVSPKSVGEKQIPSWYTVSSSMVWDQTKDANPNCGVVPCLLNRGYQWPAIEFVVNDLNAGTTDHTNSLGTGYAGYNDWYIPSIWEAVTVCYYTKGIDNLNVENSMFTAGNPINNPGAVNETTPITQTDPSKSPAAIFHGGGTEVLGTSSMVRMYSCTVSQHTIAGGAVQMIGNDNHNSYPGAKTYLQIIDTWFNYPSQYVRAIRREEA